MILVDANILMYAAGADHPHKTPCLELLSGVAEGNVDAALDAEVLQEVLHRYRAIERWSAGARVYDDARRIFSVVLPITVETLDLARHPFGRAHHDRRARCSPRGGCRVTPARWDL